jgi:type VI secretion system protein VasD
MIRVHRFRVLLIVTAAVVAVSCGRTPPPVAPPPAPQPSLTIAAPADAKTKASMVISTSADANPDANGRPSPVVIRVYQLRTDDAFTSADFSALYDDEQKVLGPSLITRNEYLLAPMERQTIDINVSGETRFVAAIAAFRDIRNAQWRSIIPPPPGGLTVTVERARVVVAAAQ